MTKLILKNGTYYLSENGKETVCKTFNERGDITIKLPENELNRKFVARKLFEKMAKDGEMELQPVTAKSPVSKTTIVRQQKGLEEYLEGDEKAEFIRLRDKARSIKNKPLSPLEKAKLELAKAQAKLAELELLGE